MSQRSYIAYARQMNSVLQNVSKNQTKVAEKQVMMIYQDAFDNIANKIKKCDKDSYRRKLLQQYAAQIYNEMNDLMRQIVQDTADQVLDKYSDLVQRGLSGRGFDQDGFDMHMKTTVNITNRQLVEQMIKGKVYDDGKSLDNRLWNVSQGAGKKLNAAIASCLAQGMGAADMSEVIKQFAHTGHHTWDRRKIREKLGDGYARSFGRSGLDYEALRLARTTITHQAQLATLAGAQVNPYMNAVRWHSSHTAGRTCTLCNDRDGTIFDLKEVPLDHPNGLCFLEPVFMINGKVATPEQIAKDMAKWASGKKNSGTMDKIYSDVAPKPVGKVTKKQTSKGAKKVTEGLYTPEERETKYAELEQVLRTQIKTTNKKYTVEGIINSLKQAPIKVQDMYLSTGKFERTTSNGGAFYSPSDFKIHMSFSDDRNLRLQFGEKHRYDVLFHEWGHLIDDQGAGDKIKNYKFSGGSQRMYTKMTLKDAIKEKGLAQSFERDMNNWKAKWVEEKFHGKKTLENTPAPLVNGKFADFLHENEVYTIALQDAAKGMSAGEVKTRWGHDLKYYTRNQDRKISAYESACMEVSSELWAEINSSMTQPETREFLYKNFPEMMKSYDKLVNEVLKTHKKK